MQAQPRPRFRQDLVAELVEEQGARFIDVADPDSGNLFRFYEVEYSLACAMDGERDVEGIVQWAREELGLSPSAQEVEAVISTLMDLRFVDPFGTAADARDTRAASKAASAGEPELVRGVVVGGAPHARDMADDVELGHSHGRGPSGRGELPAAPDLALGAPGAAATAPPRSAPVEDITLGAPGARASARPVASEVSIDLSAHVDVGAADVKEAVRASKVMSAVDVPKDVLDVLSPPDKPAAAEKLAAEKLAAEKTAAEKAAAEKLAAEKAAAEKLAAEKAVAEKAAAEKAAAAAKAAAKAPAPVAAKPADKAAKPADKAAKPADNAAKPADKAAKPPAPARSGVSPVLIVVLILAVVGAGAFLVFKYVIDKPQSAAPTAQQHPVAPAPEPLPPPPPPTATSKIVIETAPPMDVKSSAGTIDSLAATDIDVKAGDVIGLLVGHQPLETEIAMVEKDIEKRVQVELDAATKDRDAAEAAGNKAGVAAATAKIADRQKSLDAKNATLTTKKAELDKLTIKAPTDGKLSVLAKPNQKVAADAVVAKIVKPTLPVATFQVPAGTKVAADGSLSLTIGTTEQVVVCAVSDAQAETIKVACPTDAGLAEGTDVTIKLP